MSLTKISKAAFLVLLGCALESHAQTFTVLHSFSGSSDGANPEAGVVLDSGGTLYGTTVSGGPSGAGTIFKVDPNSNSSLVYRFTGGADGGSPVDKLYRDANGNLYGTTESGGSYNQGLAFEISTTGVETVLHVFGALRDGDVPAAGLIRDSNGNLFGTTMLGGRSNRGTVFKIDPSHNETVLHSFRLDGAFPQGPVILDSAGNLYGTTYGTSTTWGSVFELTPAGVSTVLHKFTGKNDGGAPRAGLIMDAGGLLYGTTVYGGTHRAGTVFKVDPVTSQETVLHSFSGGTDGGDPYGALTMDSSGNLYGTTYYGGTFGYGTIFKLDRAGHETVLYSFTGGSDGLGPMAGLTFDGAGNLYGTTYYGGANGAGVVFKLIP
jgi:uncharacterized repeat protein (TIGR03803 family)